MAAKNIRDALKRAMRKTGLRQFQYENYIVHFTFERSLIQDELKNAIKDVLVNRRSANLTRAEQTSIHNASAKVVKRAYSRRNIIKAHKRIGYRVHSGNWQKVKSQMAKMYGYTRDNSGKPINPGPRKAKLGVYVPKANAGVQGIQGLTVNIDSVPVSYVASMGLENYIRPPFGGPHQKLHKQMWANAVYMMWKELDQYAGTGTGRQRNKNPDGPMRGDQRTRVIGAKQGNQSRYRRLHGPVSSEFIGPSLPLESESLGDTSYALVGMVEALKSLGPDSVANKPPTYQEMYGYAYQDILHELDAAFTINGQSISSMLGFDKTIEIGMALGGNVHQGLMGPADIRAVEAKLDEIVEIMVNDNKWNTDYETSKGIRQRGGELVGAIAIKELLNVKWWNKPNMRLKVNKALAKSGGKEKEMAQAIESAIIAGSGKIRGIKKPKGKGSKRTKVKNDSRITAASSKQRQSPTALKNLINSVLPQMIAMKMQPPALRYRTGRFANSARVTQVMQGPRGGLSADYTYMRDPYETFEPGNKMGSVQRDPRRIIGQTIREIVAQAMQSKFIKTRRV